MKKTFIKVKRGILAPKHRVQLGDALFLFLYILDKADWESGEIYDWKDREVADETGISLSAVRRQREHLEEKKYIKVSYHGKSQSVAVNNWNDPSLSWVDKEEESGYVLGDHKCAPTKELEGDGSRVGNGWVSAGSRLGSQTCAPTIIDKIPDTRYQIPEVYTESASPTQILVEKIAALLPPQISADVVACEQIERMQPLQEDIQAAVDYLHGEGMMNITHWKSLVNPIRISISKRQKETIPKGNSVQAIQERNAAVVREILEESKNGKT